MNNLMVKSVFGFLFLIGFLGLVLFLSAGTLDYWQAWVFLAVFGLSTLLVTLYLMRYDQRLLASRVSVGPVAETRKSQQIIQSLASLFFIGVFVVSGLDQRYGWSQVSPALSLLADVLVALGFFIVFLVFRENSYTSAVVEVAEEQKVVSSGPYAVVRHPMYAGAFLLMLFAPLALASWVGLPFVLPLILVIILRLLDEEKFLAANLKGYQEYRQKVRYRLVPFVW